MVKDRQQGAPLVSVIIPTYNRSIYLKEALTTAVNQTYRHIEIIVSDNCSPENPQKLVESFRDPRIRFFRNPENLGMLPNVKLAFQKAQGKYVASLLDDDVWEKDFLEKLVPFLEGNSDLALAFCDHYMIDETGKINEALTEQTTQLYRRFGLPCGIYQPFYQLSLIDLAIPVAMASVIRRDVINWHNIPLEVGVCWDIYLGYLCCRSGLGAYYYPERLTKVRQHPQTETQISGRKNPEAKIRKGQSQIFCYEQFLKDPNLGEFRSHFQKKLAQAYATLAIGLIRQRNPIKARPYAWQALKQKISLRSVAAVLFSYTPAFVASRF